MPARGRSDEQENQMAFGRKKPEAPITLASFGVGSGAIESTRTTSYPQDQDTKAPVVGASRTTSYRTAAQHNDRGYVTIN